MTITASENIITKVVVTYDKNNSPSISWGTEATTSSTENPASWEGSATSVVFNVGTKGHARIQKVEVTYEDESPSLPSLTADDVQLAFDATSGVIEYTLGNPVDNGSMTAVVSEGYWLTLGTVGETVPFTCSANPTAVERRAIVALSYVYGEASVSKNVTVIQAANPNVVMTIAEARQQTLNTEVKTQGVVTSISGTTAYMQDENAAICVYGDANLVVGYEYTVTGTLKNYNGLLEITNPTCEMVTEGNDVTPEVMTIAQILASDKQGWLVKIEKATVTDINNQNTTIEQDGSSVVVRGISSDVNYEVGSVITLTGNIGCYNTVQIANPTDVVVSAEPFISVEETEISVSAEGGEGQIRLSFENFDSFDADIVYYDADGVVLDEAPAWILVDLYAENNYIEYIIDPNDGEARTAYLKVYATDGDNDYYSPMITITQAKPVVTTAYSLATTLVPGKHYIIASGTEGDVYAMAGQNNNNRAAVSVVAEDNVINVPEDAGVCEFFIKKDRIYYTIYDEALDGYLYAASNSSNQLKTQSTNDANGLWSIDINGDGIATIQAQGERSRNMMRYNSNNNLFACYAAVNNMADIYLFEKVDEEPVYDVTVSAAGWATYVAEANVTFPTGVSAYIVTGTTDTTVELEEVLAVVEGTPVVLNAEAGTYNLEVVAAAECDDVANKNRLQVSDETTGNGVYVLANHNNVPGFYKWAGGQLGAGRVYLPAEAAPDGARSFLGFGNGTSTGIEAVENVQTAGSMFDLQGRRVMQPTKGLYIVGGKKVVLK